jgi:hypothetical protein
MSEQRRFWFNLRTREVQTDDDKGQARDLLGPYPTAEAARNALAGAAERTEAWDEADRRWRDGDED